MYQSISSLLSPSRSSLKLRNPSPLVSRDLKSALVRGVGVRAKDLGFEGLGCRV
jgi:hypothetical protein